MLWISTGRRDIDFNCTRPRGALTFVSFSPFAHPAQTIIERSGAQNILEDQGIEEKKSWDSVAWDTIEARDPDLIVLIDASWDLARKSSAKPTSFLRLARLDLTVYCRRKDLQAVFQRTDEEIEGRPKQSIHPGTIFGVDSWGSNRCPRLQSRRGIHCHRSRRGSTIASIHSDFNRRRRKRFQPTSHREVRHSCFRRATHMEWH